MYFGRKGATVCFQLFCVFNVYVIQRLWNLNGEKCFFFSFSTKIPEEMVIKFERNKNLKNCMDFSFTFVECQGLRIISVGRSFL